MMFLSKKLIYKMNKRTIQWLILWKAKQNLIRLLISIWLHANWLYNLENKVLF